MTANPNPRTWRYSSIIVDLKRVACVLVKDSKILEIYLVGVGEVQSAGSVSLAGPIRLKVPLEIASSLMNALEIYRSER